eukprot:6767694-Heterocapsa_arctica.AAC.1
MGIASLNVKGLIETSNREQIMQHMKKHDISILCLQETRIPHSCVEDKQGYTFVFSSNSTSNDEYHGVGL